MKQGGTFPAGKRTARSMKPDETEWDSKRQHGTMWDGMGQYGTTMKSPMFFGRQKREPQDFKQQHFKLKTSNNNPIISDHERL